MVIVAILTFPLSAAAQLETIDVTARGTSTQFGHLVRIKLIITRYSSQKTGLKSVRDDKIKNFYGTAKAVPFQNTGKAEFFS